MLQESVNGNMKACEPGPMCSTLRPFGPGR